MNFVSLRYFAIIVSISILILGSNAERRDYSGFLEPLPYFVHYTTATVDAPGLIDLSQLTFTTALKEDYAGAADNSTIDIAIFTDDISLIPQGGCSNEDGTCDWTPLGVGVKNHGQITWCCTLTDQEHDRCQEPLNRLIINPSLFTGSLSSITIPGPHVATFRGKLDNPIVTIPAESSGRYVLIMANCNPDGRLVYVEGSYSFKSKSGYLSGSLLGTLRLFLVLSVAYTLLLVFILLDRGLIYSASKISKSFRAMYMVVTSSEEHENIAPSRSLLLERCIVATITMGWLEALIQAIAYSIWNSSDNHISVLTYSGIVLGIAKHTFSRGLLVLIGLGWGVLSPEAASQSSSIPRNEHYRRIFILCILYFIFVTSMELVSMSLMARVHRFSSTQDLRDDIILLYVEAFLGICILVLNLIFGVYTLSSLANTINYLKEKLAPKTLELYHRLKILLSVVSAVAILWLFFNRMSIFYHNNITVTESWLLSNLMELDYFLLTAGIAILWRNVANEDTQFHVGQEYEGGHELELREEPFQNEQVG
jgi:hypothetical protein